MVEGVFKAFNHDWESWSFDIEQYIDAGETVIVIGSNVPQLEMMISRVLEDLRSQA